MKGKWWWIEFKLRAAAASIALLMVKMFGYFALDTLRDDVLDSILLLASK
jgi:hypothetical protein